MKYDFAAIEKKWQDKWEQEKPYAAVTGDPRPKFYGLIEFPYPSAAGLHVGHPRPFTAMDIICRKKRMQGYNVLNPIGFDAFGLPTENFAIKNHIHPAIVTQQNIKNFTRQLKMLGYGFDWDRVVDTTDPNYYKWTQWIFLQMFKHDLAYKTTMPVNWCTSCKCVLANEEVVEGVCERCGSEVIRKEKSQWMLRITKYADRLIDDLDDVDFIERVKTQQRNWIGRSTGTEVTFKTNTEDDITVYTTRVDTLFGVTYTVISPEHPLLKKWQPLIKNWDEVAAYQEAAARKSDFERGELNKDKTGVRLDGIEVINPANGKALSTMYNGFYNNGTDVTLADGELSGYTATDIWTVGINEDGTYTFATSEGKKLAMQDKFSSMPLEDKAAPHTDWSVTAVTGKTDTYYIDNVYRAAEAGAKNYRMQWDTRADYLNWSAYNGTGVNFEQQFYLVVDNGGENPDPEPEPEAGLADGKYIIYNPESGKAMSADATGTYYRAGKDVTVENGKVADPSEDIIWNVSSENGVYTITPADGKKRKIAIVTGAEGGFAAEEAEMAAKAGAKTVGLGPRILRCETAPLAVLASVMTLTGNLE